MATAHTAITPRTNTEGTHTGIPAGAGDAPAITTTIGNDRAFVLSDILVTTRLNDAGNADLYDGVDDDLDGM